MTIPISRITTASILAAGIWLCALAVPPADARYSVGIGDQHAATFGHAPFLQLKLRHARLNVPWDALDRADERARTDQWLASARAARAKPLITFTHSRVNPRKLPSARTYRRIFRAFRARYPWVKQYSPWNEVNHNSQPTHRKPKAAARFYNIVRSACRGCTIVAADVLDQPGMERYLRRFLRYARGKPRRWGLHNYKDTNRFRTRGTKALLRTVRGSVWLTETGGIVRFSDNLPYSEGRAARAIRHMFRLAKSNRRIKRLYIYSYWGEPRGARFDAGLVGPDGRPRPAYSVVKSKLRR
jgi:polysaccharide biosynthesis protein PslG